MASSEQKINSASSSEIPCEDTSIISPQLASQYKVHLYSNKNWKGEEMNADERDYKLKKLKEYKEKLAPKWQLNLSQSGSRGEVGSGADFGSILGRF